MKNTVYGLFNFMDIFHLYRIDRLCVEAYDLTEKLETNPGLRVCHACNLIWNYMHVAQNLILEFSMTTTTTTTHRQS